MVPALVLALAILLSPWPVLGAGEGTGVEDRWGLVATNLLVVDALTGAILRWEDRGEKWSDVEIVGVEPSSEGYTLVSPSGWNVFENQTARADGTIAFWQVPLALGVYEVRQEQPGLDRPVTRFQTYQLAEPASLVDSLLAWPPLRALTSFLGGETTLRATHTSGREPSPGEPHENEEDEKYCTGTDKGSISCSDWCMRGWKTRLVGLKNLWTPEMVLASPWKGAAESSASQSSVLAIYVAPADFHSSVTDKVGLRAENGETLGLHRLVRWGEYERARVSWTCIVKEVVHTARILDTTPGGVRETTVFDLTEDPRTGADDLTVVTNGVEVDARYKGRDQKINVNAGLLTLETDSDLFAGLKGSITISARVIEFPAVDFEAGETSSISVKYTFPTGTWYATNLGGRDRGLAFCAPTEVPCAI